MRGDSLCHLPTWDDRNFEVPSQTGTSTAEQFGVAAALSAVGLF